MGIDQELPTEREDIEMLLPWYINGTLVGDELARVEAYLAAHPDMALQLDLVRDEQRVTIEVNEAVAGSSQHAIDALMASVARQEARSLQGWLARFLAPISTFFSMPSAGQVRWVAACVAALLIAQTVLIATLSMRNNRGGTYQTASGADNTRKTGTVLLVRFGQEATVQDISGALGDLDAVIVDGPLPGDLYKVRIDRTELEPEIRDRRIAEISRKYPFFSLITPSK